MSKTTTSEGMKRVNQFLRLDQARDLKRLARVTPGVTPSEHTRRAIDSYLKRYKARLS